MCDPNGLRSLLIGLIPGALVGAAFFGIKSFPQGGLYAAYFVSLTCLLVISALMRSVRLRFLIVSCYFGQLLSWKLLFERPEPGPNSVMSPFLGIGLMSLPPMLATTIIIGLWRSAKEKWSEPTKRS